MADFEEYYLEARKLGLREFSKDISRGGDGYLPNLDQRKSNVDIVSEIDLGVIDIPLKKIVGTYTSARSKSFAVNFMPILNLRTEFGMKWVSLCRAHLNEGLRDPVKVYEYLNRFYVVEGNKRISVLKYFDAASYMGKVSRLIPKYDESDLEIVIYYEFINFYSKTGINSIWFSKRKSFDRLYEYMAEYQTPDTSLFPDRYKYFTSTLYMPFRQIYHELGGQKLSITTGDAFLEYLKVYGVPEYIDETLLKSRLNLFVKELEQYSESKSAEVQITPHSEGESLISAITTLVRPKKVLKVAFAYAKDIRKSSWTYSHEMGRSHVERVLRDYISTSFEYNIPEDNSAYEYLKRFAEAGNDVVFATSPLFINAALKAAIEYPEVKFLNCSETHSFKMVSTYFGRIYEPRFLAGLVAGSVTGTGITGYVATHPVPEVINGINSFALGVKMANPHARIKVEWTNQWDSNDAAREAGSKLIAAGADIVSHHDTLSNREVTREYGVYSVVCGVESKNCIPGRYIAAPVWNWGIFYERILRGILNNPRKSIADLFGSGHKTVNFWWGMDSGIVDFFYSARHVPGETCKLIDLLKKSIKAGTYHPFTGPIYDSNGKMRVKPGETATHDDIITMNWLADIVEGTLPEVQQYSPENDLIKSNTLKKT